MSPGSIPAREVPMHIVALNPAVVKLTLARRGRMHAFSDLDPRHTALLVVDLQSAYLDAALALSFNQHALDIVPNVNLIARTVRATGGIVVWIQNTITEESQKSWSTYNDRVLNAERRMKRAAMLSEGAPGHAIGPG